MREQENGLVTDNTSAAAAAALLLVSNCEQSVGE